MLNRCSSGFLCTITKIAVLDPELLGLVGSRCGYNLTNDSTSFASQLFMSITNACTPLSTVEGASATTANGLKPDKRNESTTLI